MSRLTLVRNVSHLLSSVPTCKHSKRICTVCNFLYLYNDVNNQQDATTISFINLFNSALHFSGDKFAHPQEHFLTVFTAFGTMHRNCCRPVPRLRWNVSSISTVAPVGSSVRVLYQKFHFTRDIGRQQCLCIVPKAVYTVKKCS